MDSICIHYVKNVTTTDWEFLYMDPAIDYDEHKLNCITRGMIIIKENGDKIEISLFGDLRNEETYNNITPENLSRLVDASIKRDKKTA